MGWKAYSLVTKLSCIEIEKAWKSHKVIYHISDNFEPSIVAKFAINLAQAFNKYYAHIRILDENPEQDSRLILSYATVLKEALQLLGVEAPDKM